MAPNVLTKTKPQTTSQTKPNPQYRLYVKQSDLVCFHKLIRLMHELTQIYLLDPILQAKSTQSLTCATVPSAFVPSASMFSSVNAVINPAITCFNMIS